LYHTPLGESNWWKTWLAVELGYNLDTLPMKFFF